MLNTKEPQATADAVAPKDRECPRLFDYLDYRVYLSDYYTYKKATTPGFSYASFAKRARLQTKNYLKRIVDGERPISAEALPGIVDALHLGPKESLYFESLVNFNQAKDPRTKNHYFKQMRAASSDALDTAAEIAMNQYEIFSDWYFVPLFEFCELPLPSQDPKSVSLFFRGRVSPLQVKHAFETLAKLNIIKWDETAKRYVKTQAKIQYSKEIVNLAIQQFHKAMLNTTITAISEDELDSRYLRGLSISVSAEEAKEIRASLDEFIKKLNAQYSGTQTNKTTVLQINAQVLELTKQENT
jgi:uncharacterized protein (TIGR02147 family)